MPLDRIQRYCKPEENWADSMVFGPMTSKEVIERLIVCDGQTKRSFRASMFSKQMECCGVFTGEHKNLESMINIIYAD